MSSKIIRPEIPGWRQKGENNRLNNHNKILLFRWYFPISVQEICYLKLTFENVEIESEALLNNANIVTMLRCMSRIYFAYRFSITGFWREMILLEAVQPLRNGGIWEICNLIAFTDFVSSWQLIQGWHGVLTKTRTW